MKTRQSNVELLRILSMLIIVLYHISVYSSISGDQLFGANKFIQFYYGVTANSGQLGVMIFVLISSYFLCQQSFKIQRIIRIWAQLAFYVVLETIIILSFRGAFPQYFDKLKWYEVFNPLFFGSTYWFILPYVALTLLAPFLNIVVRRINQKQHLVLIGLLFLFVPVMSTLCERFGHTYWFAEIYGWWFLCYFVASYIRYYPSMKKNSWLVIATFVLSLAAYMASIVVPIYTQSPVNSGAGAQRSILMNIVAISLFCLFLNIRIPNSKTINYISSCTFGVYLFHEFIPIKNTIYHAIFKMSVDFETRFFGKAVLLLLTIFGVGIILETIRKLIDKPLFNLVDKHAVNFYEKVNDFFPDSEKGDVVDSPNLCSCVWIHMLMLVLVALFVGQLYYIKDGKINPYRYSIGLSIIIVFEVIYFLVRNKINKKKSS